MMRQDWLRLEGITLFVLLFGLFCGSAVGSEVDPTLPSSSDATEEAFSNLGHPSQEKRVKAQEELVSVVLEGTAGKVVVDRLLEALGDENYRVRIGAATVLSQVDDSRRIQAFSRALLRESTQDVRVILAAHLAGFGKEGLEALSDLKSTETGQFARLGWREYVRQAVLLSLQNLADQITNFAGGVKGFFADPVRDLAPLYGDAVDVLVSVVENPNYSLLMRSLAVRAVAEIGEWGAAPRLLPVYSEVHAYCQERGYRDRPWSIPVRPDPEKGEILDFRRYVSQALSRLGEPRPFVARLSPLLLHEKDLSARAQAAELDLADFMSRKRLRYSPQDQESLKKQIEDFSDQLRWSLIQLVRLRWFIAYDYQQVREDEEALHFYRRAIEAGLKEQKLEERSVGEVYLAYYNMACIEARRGRAKAGLMYLDRAFASGFDDVEWARKDRDLELIRHEPEFERILRAEEKRSGPEKEGR